MAKVTIKSTDTKKNKLTGRTKTITRSTSSDGTSSKTIVKRRKDGSIKKNKTIYKGKKRGDGSKVVTKFNKAGASKTKIVNKRGKTSEGTKVKRSVLKFPKLIAKKKRQKRTEKLVKKGKMSR